MSLRPALVALAVAAWAAPAVAGGGHPCPDRAPALITAPEPAGATCQRAIAQQGAKFLKKKTAALAKCLRKEAPGACPTAGVTASVEQAALKAAEKIAAACGDDAAQAALASSYGELSDESAVSSCMLSQHNALADVVVMNATGIVPGSWPTLSAAANRARARCSAQAAKEGVRFALGVLEAASQCIDRQIAAGTAGDLGPVCVGSIAANAFALPTDPKAAAKIGRLITGMENGIAKKCAGGEGGWLPSVFACGGAETADQLSACLVCEGYTSAIGFVEHQYGEDGTLVTPGTDAIETAVNGAAPGAKLLVASGTYEDPATIEQDGLRIVGCGGATNDRPRLVKPDSCPDPGECARGIFAADVDGLVFQSLEVEGWTGDGIFVTGAQGVTFRDIVGDGGAGDPTSSRYAVFPVNSSGILVETCQVRDISDAGIYVGQSSDIVVRFNEITTSVAGIELENSAFGVAHNNFATGNTAGILVFKDGSLPVQLSNDHRVAHNVFVDNNGPNYGSGNVAGVPVGTGILLISDDDGLYEYNLVTGNDSFGFGLVDQVAADFNQSDELEDVRATGATVRHNVFAGNGGNPDDEAPFGADFAMILFAGNVDGVPLYGTPPVHGNCFEDDNLVEQDPIFLGVPNQCP